MPGVGLGGTGVPKESGLGAGDVEIEGQGPAVLVCPAGWDVPRLSKLYLNSLLLPLLAWTGIGLKKANVAVCQMGHCTSTRPSSDPLSGT